MTNDKHQKEKERQESEHCLRFELFIGKRISSSSSCNIKRPSRKWIDGSKKSEQPKSCEHEKKAHPQHSMYSVGWPRHCCYKYLVISLNIQIRLHGCCCFNVIATFTPFVFLSALEYFFLHQSRGKNRNKKIQRQSMYQKSESVSQSVCRRQNKMRNFFFAITLDYTAADSVLWENARNHRRQIWGSQFACQAGLLSHFFSLFTFNWPNIRLCKWAL